MTPSRSDIRGSAGEERQPAAPPPTREIRIAAALLVPAGLAICALAIFADRLGIEAGVSAGVFGSKRIALLLAGLSILAVAAIVGARPRTVSGPRAWERVLRYTGYLPIALLALLGVALVWTRLVHIDESLGHDAAFTALNYIDGGPDAILLAEQSFDVNNHVAYNLLTWATVGIFGESETTYRLWSAVPGIAAIALGVWWGWNRLGPTTAVAFATLSVAATLHLELVAEARGYGLAILAATLMLIAADRLTRGYSRRGFLGFLGAGVLGIWTLFIFAIAFVGQALALLRWPELRRPVVAVVGAAAVLSLAFYAPVLGDLAGARALGEPIPLWQAVSLYQAVEWLAVPSFTVVTRGQPTAWLTLGGVALVVVAVVALWRRGEVGLALLLVAPPLLFNLVFGFAGLETVPRHQFLLLTHVLFLVAIGITELAAIVTRYRPLRPAAVGAAVLAVLVLSSAIIEEERGEVVPPENFKEVATVARGSGITPAITDSPRPEGFRYYLGDDLVVLTPEQTEDVLCGPRRETVYIRHVPIPREQWSVWAPASLDCLVGRDAVRIRVPQRARGAAIDVWIVDPRAAERIQPGE